MRTTPYFEEQILRKRPYIERQWCVEALHRPERMEVDGDSRVYYWISVPKLSKPLRVVALSDGKTVHDAYPDGSIVEVVS